HLVDVLAGHDHAAVDDPGRDRRELARRYGRHRFVEEGKPALDVSVAGGGRAAPPPAVTAAIASSRRASPRLTSPWRRRISPCVRTARPNRSRSSNRLATSAAAAAVSAGPSPSPSGSCWSATGA